MKYVFTKDDLVSFGNYLLSQERKKLTRVINRENVTHADLENWRDTEENRVWRPGDKVRITAKLHGKHSHKFDIEEVVTLCYHSEDDHQTPWLAKGNSDNGWISEEEAELI